MPFTFSHPAILLPFVRRNKEKILFSATAMVIGSIAPDFESFISLHERKIYSHTWPGMFWFDLPLAFILCLIFQLLIKKPLIENLPAPLEERFSVYKDFNWLQFLGKHYIVVVISLLVGISSHLLWDAFTHLNLRDPDSTRSQIIWGRTRAYIVLQYVCSLIGLFIIAVYIYRMPRKKTVATASNKFKYWLFLLLTACLIGSWTGTNIYYQSDDLITYYKGYVIIIIYICISALLAALIIVSVVYRLMAWLHKNKRNNGITVK